jgi:pyruvate dehydrogenase E2 component (dihydrolipoamide acetyltransferase)
MITDFVMPKLAMAMNEGTINNWMVEEGTFVEKGTTIAEVETEKVVYEIESPHEGYIHMVVQAGETVPVEVPISRFASDEETYRSLVSGEVPAGAETEPARSQAAATGSGSSPEASAAALKSSEAGRMKVSPVARKMAKQRGIDLATVQGTGPGGRIMKEDILKAEQRSAESSAAQPAETKTTTTAAAPAAFPASSPEAVRVPFKGVRAAIAKRMLESLGTSAQLSSFWEVELDGLLKLRQEFLQREGQLGTRVSVNALLVKAIAWAAARVPIANSGIDGDEIVIHRGVNVGIATALPGPTEYDSVLVVPVIRNVQAMGVVEIDIAMKSLVDRARRNELGADELTGSTITFSTTAGLSPPGTYSTPVLNLPNTTLIGPGTPSRKPVVRNDEMVIRTMLPISMTFDHRVMDGEPAARFARALSEAIEHPGLMLG